MGMKDEKSFLLDDFFKISKIDNLIIENSLILIEFHQNLFLKNSQTKTNPELNFKSLPEFKQ